MQGNYLKKILLVATALIFINSIGTAVYGLGAIDKELSSTSYDGYTNITVEEAWTLLSDTSNGIQEPIDVRTLMEWKDERIDTPYPENPKHHCLDDLEDEIKLMEFIELYEGKELILYCHAGGRSVTAAEILVENNFSGVLYNMLGGITAWKSAELPTLTNQPPEVEIINPKEGYFHFSGYPILPTPFDLIADTLALGGFRLNPIIINATDDLDDRENVTVKVYLNDELQGEAEYCCDWKLHEWFWTGWALGNYKLKVTAADLEGNTNSAEIDVWNFCFIP